MSHSPREVKLWFSGNPRTSPTLSSAPEILSTGYTLDSSEVLKTKTKPKTFGCSVSLGVGLKPRHGHLKSVPGDSNMLLGLKTAVLISLSASGSLFTDFNQLGLRPLEVSWGGGCTGSFCSVPQMCLLITFTLGAY